MKIKSFFIALLCSSAIFASIQSNQSILLKNIYTEDIQANKTWTEVLTFSGIKIEYKFEECNSANVKNQILVLFRFTNTTKQKQKFSWTLEQYRDGECSNCIRIENPEYSHEIVLDANETIEGNCDSKENKVLYLFSNFVKLSPGMTDTYLNNFKFINLNASVVK